MSVIWIDSGRFAVAAGGGYSAPAQDYINRVIAADVLAGNITGLEPAVQDAYAAFIDDLITDGILGVSGGVINQASSLIKASCILAGAKTLAGALVPLVGTAPTNNGPFINDDYNRETGLKGNGSSKYLNSNYAATQRDNVHMAAYTTETSTVAPQGPVIMGTSTTSFESRSILYQDSGTTSAFFCINSAIDTAYPGTVSYANGFRGTTRSSSVAVSSRIVGTTFTKSILASSLITTTFYVFGENRNNSAAAVNNYRIPFYSVGESLVLSSLETRVNTLMTALAAAI
jgi:hypothetical protein